MTTRRAILRACRASLLAALAAGCRTTDSNPDYKLSSRVLAGSVDQVALAITNSFSDGAYHGCKLIYSPCDYVKTNGQEVAVPTTNSWLLCAERMPLTLIRSGKTMLAYREEFEIRAEPVDSDKTKVNITSAGSGTIERSYELSMHLGRILSHRHIPPFPSETTNLFLRIEQAVLAIQDGRREPLPPTADTHAGFYREFWTELTVEEKHDRRNWDDMVRAWSELQENHSPQGGANGRHPSGSEANSGSAAAGAGSGR